MKRRLFLLGRSAITVLLVAGTAPQGWAADPVAVGPQILVSTEEAYFPRIASDPAGNFMVVWEDSYEDSLQARRWFATGNEFLPQFQLSGANETVDAAVSTSTGSAGIASDAAGNFMITYVGGEAYPYGGDPFAHCVEADPCLYLKRSDANGITGPKFLIHDPVTTYVYEEFEDDQVSNPEVAALANGDFVVVWEGYDSFVDDFGPFSDEGVFAARAGSTGQPIGSYFRVNTYAEGYQGQYGSLAASGDPDGGFTVVFRSEYDYEGFPGGTTHAQLYNNKAKRVGTEFGLSSTDDDGRTVDIARTPDGTFMVIWSFGFVAGRIFNADGTAVTDDFEISSVGNVSAIAASNDSFVVVWDDAPGIAGQRFDVAGNEQSNEFPIGSGELPDVAAAANGDFTVTWLDDFQVVAQRFQVAAPVEQQIGVAGKSLVLTNKVPDDPEKNQGKWKSSGAELVAPLRGSASDPRCNGDPIGTVKATVEFRSASSGHGSGVIGLPCQNWLATAGTSVKQANSRTYFYRDSQLDQGPCSSIVFKSAKSLSVTCKGSGASTDFPYDLVPGTSEGTVHAILDMGLLKYCASFPPSGSANGSDGKTFKGAKTAVGACPP